jgi:predicted amidohydrolase YtcJ
MSDACCTPSPIAHSHVGEAVKTAGTTITPAHHAKAKPVTATADLLVVGKISTGNPASPTAEAIAISGGAIIGIGGLAAVAGLPNASTTILKPEGVVIPGLIEPHMHIWTSLLNLNWTDISHDECPTFDSVVAKIKDVAAQTPDGQYVLGKLFDPSLYPGEPDLTRVILDQVSPNNPVMVMNASQHYLYANSAAFEKAGITDQTPDPVGGKFGRVDGKLNGVIGEAAAIMQVAGSLPKSTPADMAAGIEQILNMCASQGVTSLREAVTGAIAGVAEVAMLHQLNGAKRFPVRVSTAQFSMMQGKTSAEVAATWKEAGITPFSGDEMVRADAWKVVTDGSNQGRSGYFMQPYLGEVTGGQANWTPDGMHDVLKAGIDDGWQLMCHTNGDGAVEFALSTLEKLLPTYGTTDLRHRFEHCSITSDDQLERMAAAGISPSFLMNHVYYWGAAFRDTILGEERANHLDRVASAYKFGLRPSLHSDFNVSKVHPLQIARTAALRQMQANGEVLNPAECATPEQALAAITTNAAWQIHADDRGSLEVGKRADFAVVDIDPWTSAAAGWDQIKVYETYIDGTIAFQA